MNTILKPRWGIRSRCRSAPLCDRWRGPLPGTAAGTFRCGRCECRHLSPPPASARVCFFSNSLRPTSATLTRAGPTLAELRDACGTRMRLVVGSGVETGTRRHTDLAPGDPVVISFPWCGECGPCRAARMSRICQYCRSLVSFQREFVDRAILSLKHAGVPSFLIE